MAPIKYVCGYKIPVENDEGRDYFVSAVDKASYIHEVLVRLGYSVDIISPATTRKTARSRRDSVNDKITVVSGFSLGRDNILTRPFSRISSMLWLFFYMLKHCKRGETVFLYHGVPKIPVCLLVKKIKRLKYVLEVEEIYSLKSEVAEKKWRLNLEEKMIEKSDAYIFVSEVLEKRYNKSNKPVAVAYGAYRLPALKTEKKQDGKIHVLYAGIIEMDGVAFTSVRIAKYLDSRFQIHISGYGNDDVVQALLEEIKTSNQSSDCQVSFEGFIKNNDEYQVFLQSCHIGICPMSLDYQMSCFPSKISVYLSNGLKVVTTENPVLKESRYRPYLYFVPDDKPESFATVIKEEVTLQGDSPRVSIAELDIKLQKSLDDMLKKLNTK